MARLYSPDDAYVKEMAKHEQFESKWTMEGLKPGNPYVYRELPRMTYKAQRLPDGKWALEMPQPSRFGYTGDAEWGHACQQASLFASGCQKIVNTLVEYHRARDDGWRDSAAEALAWRESLESAVGLAAAERAAADAKMSEKARAEARAAEAEHFGHLPEVSAAKVLKRRPGRPRKETVVQG